MNKFMEFTSKGGIIVLGILVMMALMKNLLIGSLLGIILVILVLKIISYNRTIKESREEEDNLVQYKRARCTVPEDAKKIKISEFYYKEISCNNVDTLWWLENNTVFIISSDFKDDFGIINIFKEDIWYFTTMDKIYSTQEIYKKDCSNFNGNAVNDLVSITIKDVKQLNTKCECNNNEVVMAIKDEDDFSYMYLEEKSYNDLVDILPSKELKD